MDNPSQESSIAKGKVSIPGMNQGAGDGASSYPSSMEGLEDDPTTLQAALASLHLQEKSSQGEEQNWDSEEDTSDDDASEIEPQCSYPFGYLKRQTVYICVTCNDPSKEGWRPAGICIGCRNACHHDHEVISLETRRSFRCDCGNKKCLQTPCILCPEKEDTNELNSYNHNFTGTFCTCKCKEADCIVEDPLYQCVVCEDWYHANHCNSKTEGIEKNYTDLVCGDCTSKLDFLRYYEPFDTSLVVDESAIDEMIQYTEADSGDEEEPVVDAAQCKLYTLPKKDPYTTGHLWTLGWRGKLCRCVKCKDMYASLNVSFLLDIEDEVRRYFTPSEEEDEGRLKICNAVMRFEQWLFKMDPKEREEAFNGGPDLAKAKLKEHFVKSGAEFGFDFDDDMLDHLFQAFKEYILDAEGGVEYLDDMDILAKLQTKLVGECDAEGDDKNKNPNQAIPISNGQVQGDEENII